MNHALITALFEWVLLVAGACLITTVHRYRHEIVAALLNEFDRKEHP